MLERDDSRRWPCTQARPLWLLGIPCWLESDDGGGRLGIGGRGSREGVRYHIFYPGHILYVSCVFSYIAELPLLPQHPGIGAAAEGIGEGAMICPQLKLPALYLETEVSNGAESCQQLPVERAIGHLSAVQLFGEEPQWLPRVSAAAALKKSCSHVT